jgi:hypothetical protein
MEGVGASADFGAVFENGIDELFGDGAAADEFEVIDLGKELVAAGMDLGGGGCHM